MVALCCQANELKGADCYTDNLKYSLTCYVWEGVINNNLVNKRVKRQMKRINYFFGKIKLKRNEFVCSK